MRHGVRILLLCVLAGPTAARAQAPPDPMDEAETRLQVISARADLEQGERLLKLRHFERGAKVIEQAIVTLDTVCQADPTHAQAHFLLGRANFRLERDQQALKAVSRAVALEPKRHDYRLLRAKVLRYLGKLVDAELELHRCVELAPRNVECHLELARVQAGRMKHDQALATYKKAAELAPGQVGPVFKIGVLLTEIQRPDEAVQYFLQAARLEPAAAMPHYNIGQIRQGQSKYKESLASFQEVLRLDPTQWQALAKCVQLYQAMGQLPRRDEARGRLLAMRKAGKIASLTRAAHYCRDQYEVGGRKVMVFEHFELTGAMARRYVFFVLKPPAQKVEYRVSLGSYEMTNLIAREKGRLKAGQRLFHLDRYVGEAHELYGIFEAEPPYAQVKDMVGRIVRKEMQAVSRSVPVAPRRPAPATQPARKPKPAARTQPAEIPAEDVKP